MKCCHCGSHNVNVTDTGNGGTLVVTEEYAGGEDVFDGSVLYMHCGNCNGIFYIPSE